MYKFSLQSGRITNPKKQIGKETHTEREEVKRDSKAGPGGTAGAPVRDQTTRQRPQRHRPTGATAANFYFSLKTITSAPAGGQGEGAGGTPCLRDLETSPTPACPARAPLPRPCPPRSLPASRGGVTAAALATGTKLKRHGALGCSGFFRRPRAMGPGGLSQGSAPSLDGR